jgi:hypothetical protein
MAKIKYIERRIRNIEGFDVSILTRDGRNIRGDLSGIPQYYDYEKAASNDMTVEKWRLIRFRSLYPYFDADVLDGKGESVHGNTKLSTVRDTYFKIKKS